MAQMKHAHEQSGAVPPVIVAIVVAAAIGVWVAGSSADTYHARPDPRKSGGITGLITPTADLQTVIAVEPIAMKAYQGNLDKETGQFTFGGLPAGEYACMKG